MKVFEPKVPYLNGNNRGSYFEKYSDGKPLNAANKKDIIQSAIDAISKHDKNNFYPLIEELFFYLGFNCKVSRIGDTNNRADAYIFDDIHSMPIEIKSPSEVQFINIKSIRQAVENKIILLSRKFFNTKRDTTSLAIGFTYPADRSDVIELIDDIHSSYGINIGIISVYDLMVSVWDLQVNNIEFDTLKIFNLRGKFK